MREISIQTKIKVYETPESLSIPTQSLLREALDLAKKAYAPYSNFRVGATILLLNGLTTGGNNFENAAYPMCLCAERAALANARTQYPDEKIEAIAIRVIGPSRILQQPAAPCGSCRQILCEAEEVLGHPIRIFLQGQEGPIYEMESAKDLLPLAFSGKFLK